MNAAHAARNITPESSMRAVLRTGLALLLILGASIPATQAETTWRSLRVAPESRCSPYRAEDYPYSHRLETQIIASYGGRIYAPYTRQVFESPTQTDIEHIVARSEAHDSGLCAADATTKRRFAADPHNLTLATPDTNRCGPGGKCALDAADWLPPHNRCWFAARVWQVRHRYALTIDAREAAALEAVLSTCTSFDMLGPRPPDKGRATPTMRSAALTRYDDNANGRISCAEARAHAIAPVPREHPAYAYMRDADADGMVCE